MVIDRNTGSLRSSTVSTFGFDSRSIAPCIAMSDKGVASSSAASSSTGSDILVSQAQLNQAMAHFARMQQETMQNVQQMQASLHQLTAHTSHSHNGAIPPQAPQPVPPTTSIPGFVKLAKPSLFTGATRANVETWLFEVEQYLMAYGVTNDSQRIAFAAASLKGLAIQWWQNHCLLHPGLGLTWEQFKEEVRRRFQPVEASRTARVNLRSLKQGSKSVSEYCSAFYEQLQLIHDMSEADKVENFMMGLNSTIYAEVDRRDPLNLQDAMTFAQRTEIRSRVRAVQRGTSYDSYRQNRFYNHTRTNGHERSSTSSHEVSNAGTHSTPMELGRLGLEEEAEEEGELEWKEYLSEFAQEEYSDVSGVDEEELHDNNDQQENNPQINAIAIKGQLPKEEFLRLRKEGKCYHCKKPGHFKRQCPNLQRPQRRNGAPTNRPSKY